VVGLMASVQSEPVNTFTMSFEEEQFDESPYAEIISKKFNTRHTTVKVKPSLFLDELQDALNAMDSPSGDGINSYVVSKKIRESGITVALSGIGGDELFAGYPIFKQFLQLQKYEKVWGISSPFRKAFAGIYGAQTSANPRLQQMLRLHSASIRDAYPLFRQVLSPGSIMAVTNLTPHVQSILGDTNGWQKFPLLSQVTMAELNGYTQHTLLKDTDQMSMAASLEVREPFFDHDLVEYVLNIPDSVKFPSTPKKLLVDSVADLLPQEIVHRKKQGFLMPWEVWLKNELKPFTEKLVHQIGQRDFINHEALTAKWNRFLAGDSKERWLELWVFAVLEYWMEKNDIE
jgi:asparagine synthase (glutamine-hydrolysing)